MKLTNNTILISGGTAGIGFEIAKLLTEKGNHVIITGRDQKRLDEAVAKLDNVTGILFDTTKEADTDLLVSRISADFPELNIVINNAGLAYTYDVTAGGRTWEKAGNEMETNYISLIRLTEKLLPQLLKQKAAALVNVSSIVAIAPGLSVLTYSASKAAVHAYSQGLRIALKDTSVKVFELMPPLVNTEFSKEIGGAERGIPPLQVANEFVDALAQDTYEIHVGVTAQIFELARTSPTAALNALNNLEG
ncbi:putative oxidoreductase [Pedobacter cryoconitis]|uniref:Putative oxidoreductase n=1 Tax=Pedobacter cryoconitis TaxID=188932 RepID=A0A7W8ZIK6_9SPHI|nr:SDR family NAD(P)-dependent oxidoreductase [Pedobacter cryoconitis]MBB5634453.1 putative oxidoreductase [Pedobacter cryoconitis]